MVLQFVEVVPKLNKEYSAHFHSNLINRVINFLTSICIFLKLIRLKKNENRKINVLTISNKSVHSRLLLEVY